MATADLPRTLPYQPLRMSVERYHELARLGAFADHDRVELLDGVVTEKMTKNPQHTFATRGCDLALSKLASPGWHIRNQEPITLTTSEPEPDVAIIRGKREVYAQRHPLPSEVALVIEVADTSLVTDHYKAELYAAAGIAEYWIVKYRAGNYCRKLHRNHNPLRQQGPIVSDFPSLLTLRVTIVATVISRTMLTWPNR